MSNTLCACTVFLRSGVPLFLKACDVRRRVALAALQRIRSGWAPPQLRHVCSVATSPGPFLKQRRPSFHLASLLAYALFILRGCPSRPPNSPLIIIILASRYGKPPVPATLAV